MFYVYNKHTSKTVTQTVVTSWANICHTLMEADDHWWKTSQSTATSTTVVPLVASSHRSTNTPVANIDDADTIPTVRTKHPKSSTTSKRNNTVLSQSVTTMASSMTHTKKYRPSPVVRGGAVTLGQPESTNTTTEDDVAPDDAEDNSYATPMDGDDDDPSMTVTTNYAHDDHDNDSVSLF